MHPCTTRSAWRIDVLRDGLAAGGDRARAANYTAAVGVDDGRIVLRDQHTGAEVPFAASVVVNASGPWTDLTNLVLGEPTDHMGGTKGSHIVLDHPELLAATGGRELFFEHKDGRIVLIYPLKGRVLVGTTDLEHDMRDPIVCTEAEVDYFIDLVRYVLPDITVDRSRIIYRFSGVRPLPGHGDLAPGFVSRDYRIESAALAGRADATVLSLVGGKWTTFRASAEHLADRVLELLAQPRRRSTKGVPIGGGRGYPTTERSRRQWIAAHARRARPRAGRDTARPLRHHRGRRDRGDRRRPGRRCRSPTLPTYSTAELRHLARTEDVVHLDDVLMRRTSLAFIGAVTAESALEVAEAVAPVLGWDAAQCRAETDRALAKVHAADPTWAASASARSSASR